MGFTYLLNAIDRLSIVVVSTDTFSSFQEVDGVKVLQLETAAGAAIRVHFILEILCLLCLYSMDVNALY